MYNSYLSNKYDYIKIGNQWLQFENSSIAQIKRFIVSSTMVKF